MLMFTTKDTKASADRLSLCRELLLRGIKFERQVAMPVCYRGMELECGYRVDLIVGGLVIVEVKVVSKVLPIHRAQLMTYLKLMRLNLGFIINFNVERLRLGLPRIVLG